MNVAHHTVYPVWFEMGRTELLRTTGITYRDMEAEGMLLAVVDLRVRYRKPARYDDELTLHTRLADVGQVKIVHHYELKRDGVLLATGESTLACLDRNGNIKPVPEMLKAL